MNFQELKETEKEAIENLKTVRISETGSQFSLNSFTTNAVKDAEKLVSEARCAILMYIVKNGPVDYDGIAWTSEMARNELIASELF